MQKINRLTWVFIALYAVLSAYVMLNYLQSTLLRERYIPTRFEAIISGEGHTPYIYRQLVPMLVRAVVALTPDTMEYQTPASDTAMDEVEPEEITQDKSQASQKAMPWLDKILPPNQPSYPRLVALVIVYGFLLGYICFMRRLSEAIFPQDEAMRLFVPLFALFAIPSFTWPFQYIYDFSTLALSAACYWLIAVRNFRWYMIAFVAACLNKETSIFILLFFAIWCYGKLPRERYAQLLLAQCVIYAVIKLTLTVIYQDNPGGILESHINNVLNKDLFANANSFRIAAMAAIFFLMTFQWQAKPAFAKIALLFIPILLVAYIFHGNPGEYRICFDILPLLTLLATHTLIHGTGIAQSPIFKKEIA